MNLLSTASLTKHLLSAGGYMTEGTHACLADTPRSQETVGYSAGHDVTLGT